jgi:hypothetical protein
MVGLFSEQSARQSWGILSGTTPPSGYAPTRGTRETLEGYSTSPWLRAVGSKVASSFASTEWRIMVPRKKGNGKAVLRKHISRASKGDRSRLLKRLEADGELEVLDNHPFLDLIYDANGFMTGEAMRNVTMLHIDMVGEAFWLKERNGVGAPVGVWPIPPHWVTQTPSPTHPFYQVSFGSWQGQIPEAEILWFKQIDPLNPYGRGTGVARSLADELDTDEYAAKTGKAAFFNQARPDFVVFPKARTGEFDASATVSQVNRLEQDWTNHTQGFWRRFKPYFMSREVGIHEFKQDFQSVQLLDIRKYEAETIVRVWGVPPEIFGMLGSTDRRSLGLARSVFAEQVLIPRLEFVRGVLQERLLPEFDERLIVDYVSPVPEDQEFKLEVAKANPAALSIDEWRELGGLPEKEDGSGEVHAVPFNVSLQELDTPLPQRPSAAPPF